MKTKLWGEIYKILPTWASVAIKKFVTRVLKLKTIVKNTLVLVGLKVFVRPCWCCARALARGSPTSVMHYDNKDPFVNFTVNERGNRFLKRAKTGLHSQQSSEGWALQATGRLQILQCEVLREKRIFNPTRWVWAACLLVEPSLVLARNTNKGEVRGFTRETKKIGYF